MAFLSEIHQQGYVSNEGLAESLKSGPPLSPAVAEKVQETLSGWSVGLPSLPTSIAAALARSIPLDRLGRFLDLVDLDQEEEVFELLSILAARLAERPPPERLEGWIVCASKLGSRSRVDSARRLLALAPLIEALGGNELLISTYESLKFAYRCWS